jgi:hypothetical protein
MTVHVWAVNLHTCNTRQVALVARCTRCDWSFTRLHGRPGAFREAIDRHERAACVDRAPGQHLAARVTTLRIGLELARSRGRMWLVSPAYDPARNATQVVREMVVFLEEALGC